MDGKRQKFASEEEKAKWFETIKINLGELPKHYETSVTIAIPKLGVKEERPQYWAYDIEFLIDDLLEEVYDTAEEDFIKNVIINYTFGINNKAFIQIKEDGIIKKYNCEQIEVEKTARWVCKEQRYKCYESKLVGSYCEDIGEIIEEGEELAEIRKLLRK